MEKTCYIIAGPTAVGKTALALQLAQQLDTEILSADSRQCYKELGIAVAKPSEEELAQVPHHFINSHTVHDEVNAAVFEDYALDVCRKVFEHRDSIVMVGGTGLYIQAFCNGLDNMPFIPPATRDQVIAGYSTGGLAWLQQQLQEKDPDFFATAERENPQRLMRALEVILATGRSISHFRSGNKKQRPFAIVKAALELPRSELNERIDNRVDGMVTAGLVAEAASLLPLQHLNALQTVGYRELFAYHEGRTSLAAAIASIKTNTRQYAKRQMTWFKKDPAFRWCSPDFTALQAILFGT